MSWIFLIPGQPNRGGRRHRRRNRHNHQPQQPRKEEPNSLVQVICWFLFLCVCLAAFQSCTGTNRQPVNYYNTR